MLNILFPKSCCGCESVLSEVEELLCVMCRHNLPLINFNEITNNSMKKKFYGRISIENAITLFQFHKGGLIQELLHQMKYYGVPELSAFFGEWLGSELINMTGFSEIDTVVPVPLHKQKLKKRGYNQVEGFGKAIALALNANYEDDVLIKISKTDSQTLKNRLLRFGTEEIFTVQKIERLEGKHILLVDDIVTTGATLEKCAIQLFKAKNIKLSIATIAVT